MNRVVWTEYALSNLRAIRTYIAQFNPQAAGELATRLVAAGNSLKDFPHRGRHVPGTDLRELTGVNPYVLRYRIEHGTVIILRVRHGSRRPTAP